MGGFCLVVQFHQEGSATNEATLSSYFHDKFFLITESFDQVKWAELVAFEPFHNSIELGRVAKHDLTCLTLRAHSLYFFEGPDALC